MKEDKLLAGVHRSAQNGLLTIPILQQLTECERFREVTNKQLRGYRRVCRAAKALAPKSGTADFDMSCLAMARAVICLKIGTITDRSSSHLAEMLIMGTTAGYTDLRRRISEFKNAPRTVRVLAECLSDMEERYLADLRQFL